MVTTDITTGGTVFEPQVYEFQGINYIAIAIPFFAPEGGDGRERLYQKIECDRGDCHTVLSWAPGRGSLPHPHLEVFRGENALLTAYPCLRGLLRGAATRWSLQHCCTVYDLYQHWRSETRPNVDIMPIELRGKCCFVVRRFGWRGEPLFDHLTLPIALLEFRPEGDRVAAALHVAGTVTGLAFAHPDLQPYLERGLVRSHVTRLERRRTLQVDFGDSHLITDPQVTVLPLKGAGQRLLIQRRFPVAAGPARSTFTLLAWTRDSADAGSLCTDYATLDALVRKHPDLEAPLVKYHQDVVPIAGGGVV